MNTAATIMRLLLISIAIFFCASAQDLPTKTLNKVNERSDVKQAKTSPCNSCSCGMPGIPGTHGIPGTPGQPGTMGPRGEKGDRGNPGRRGPSGPAGNKGNTGPQGVWGKPGKMGLPGKTGPRGFPGEKGERGLKGFQGQVGAPGKLGPSGRREMNWKQCVWKRSDAKEAGKIQECVFVKKGASTSLKVSFHGNLQVSGRGATCSRWYFTFNDQECTSPATIEGVYYYQWTHNSSPPNIRYHRTIEGYCANIRRGTARVALWIGNCEGERSGYGHTGWNSVSRMIVEEVPPPQQ